MCRNEGSFEKKLSQPRKKQNGCLVKPNPKLMKNYVRIWRQERQMYMSFVKMRGRMNKDFR